MSSKHPSNSTIDTTNVSGNTPEKGDKRRVRQSAKRASYDYQDLIKVLDACTIGHVSFVLDGWPQSIPTAIARLDDSLYLHGSRSSRLFQTLAAGSRLCISVCCVDGLVKARSAFHCSMNYRSAVVFGCGESITGETKRSLLDRFTEHLIPGSADDFRAVLDKEIKATELIRVPLDEFSVKIRTGDPVDDEEDINLPHWAGVIPISSVFGEFQDAANLPAGNEPGDQLVSALSN